MPFNKLFGAAALCTLLAGCNDYFDNDDLMTPGSGEAQATNRAVQMVDPWPAHSARNNFGMDGGRAEKAMEKYHSGTAPAASAPAGAAGTASAGTSENSGNQ